MTRSSEGDRKMAARRTHWTNWTHLSPFQGMQDATRGSFEQRAAAYRHNRSKRNELLACMGRWAITSAVALLLTSYVQTLGSTSSILGLLAVAGGLFGTTGICILTVGTCAYLHLAYDQR